MSQRHRDAEPLVPAKQELRAHAHGERHRIHAELSNGLAGQRRDRPGRRARAGDGVEARASPRP